MKVNKLIRKMYRAILQSKKKQEKKLYLKILKKSLKHKHTEAVQQSSLLLSLLGKEMKCNPHPNAPHGYLRDASHDANRYVCECEWWSEKDYELATLEEAEAFAEKRNCPWDEWKASKDIVQF